MQDIIQQFVLLWSVIDPIGTIPVFIAVAAGLSDPKDRRKLAIKATLVAAGVLLFFVVAGEFLLDAMQIPLPAFQISGGIVLFLFALSMIFGESKPEEETRLAADHTETAIFPLAVPSIAGPGAMLAAVLMTENARFGLWEQLQTVGVMLSVLLVVLVLLLAASGIHKIIGNAGASVISRVMGMVLAAVATTTTLEGLRGYFGF